MENNPLGSGFKKVGYYGLTVLGLKALDNAIGKWMDTKASLADKLFASFEAILASASSEEGGGGLGEGMGEGMGEGIGEGIGEGGGEPVEFTLEKYREPVESRPYDRIEIEIRSGKAVRQKDGLKDWNDFLGPDQTNIDPRDGLPDPDRIWSADGKRSIRFGDHETRNPNTNRWHYHRETWYPDRVENVLQRVQK